jgi:hypothetical protein
VIPKDKQRFAQSMAIMGEAFQKQPTDPMIDVYWRILQDMSIDEFEAATLKLINTRTITGTFPLVAEIRAAISTDIPLESKAAIAWDKFIYAVRNHAPYDSVAFDDPIISHIITNWGGWPDMGDWPEDETHFRRREFQKLYEAYVKTGNMPPFIGHHIGLVEHENTKTGFVEFIPQIKLIKWEEGKILAIPYQEKAPRVRLAGTTPTP